LRFRRGGGGAGEGEEEVGEEGGRGVAACEEDVRDSERRRKGVGWGSWVERVVRMLGRVGVEWWRDLAMRVSTKSGFVS
jgi:hypothetical protein